QPLVVTSVGRQLEPQHLRWNPQDACPLVQLGQILRRRTVLQPTQLRLSDPSPRCDNILREGLSVPRVLSIRPNHCAHVPRRQRVSQPVVTPEISRNDGSPDHGLPPLSLASTTQLTTVVTGKASATTAISGFPSTHTVTVLRHTDPSGTSATPPARPRTRRRHPIQPLRTTRSNGPMGHCRPEPNVQTSMPL